jgi:hypothetical protein
MPTIQPAGALKNKGVKNPLWKVRIFDFRS